MIDLLPVRQLAVRLTGEAWRFEAENAERIDQHWRKLTADNPHLWNGRVMKLASFDMADGVFSGSMVEASYAAFLAWRDWNYPDPNIRNLFGSAVIRARGGELVFGKMAAYTATAGLVYPPGGNLDPDDLREDGELDVEGSISRELGEETGLDAGEALTHSTFALFDGPRISISRVFEFPYTAKEIVARVDEHNAREERPELEGAVVLSKSSDTDGLAMPPYARALADRLLAI
ncbi:NUDIX domain-containing protein [Rhizobiales bacterium]|uniref:NUDIX domain-containing protein n=1 Tax=Hongsoonwoonella zoysiae TaxID=2821844 RepID=UPI0015616162|nr:NUDIX domain-containing protein [Hongsoonwoonella zoysiae]NRG17885.1 NUDIX domain-containing protein [Hongsoonwoonella zoysiae]